VILGLHQPYSHHALVPPRLSGEGVLVFVGNTSQMLL
jgi:hypothetical protein